MNITMQDSQDRRRSHDLGILPGDVTLQERSTLKKEARDIWRYVTELG